MMNEVLNAVSFFCLGFCFANMLEAIRITRRIERRLAESNEKLKEMTR